MQPKGGAPPSVYWRRRLILLAVVLLVTAGGFKLFGGGGDDGDGAEPLANAQPSPDENDDPDRPDRNEQHRERRNRDRGEDATAGERDVPVTLRHEGTCDPAEVTVTPSLLPDTYAGDAVALRLAFSTTADAPCRLSLSEHTPLVSISDGSDLVWESQRCTELIDVESVRLEPGWLTYVDAAWSGRGSVHMCGENADFAESGSYEVQAAVLGGEPTSATVELAEEPEPEEDDAQQHGQDDRDEQRKKDADSTDEPGAGASDDEPSDDEPTDTDTSGDDQT